MKTTIEINDVLLQRAKQLAAERNLSLRAIIESALREFIDAAQQQPRPAFRLRKRPFRGRGLQPGLDWHDWATIRALAYEGRGG